MDFLCSRCDNKIFSTYDNLRKHTAIKHKINSFNFYLEYIWKGEYPKCSCGCGEILSERTILLYHLKPDIPYEAYCYTHQNRVSGKNNYNKPGLHEKASTTLKKRYANGELVSWQTGKTKDNCEGLRKISEKSKGREIIWKDKLKIPKTEKQKEASRKQWKERLENDKEFKNIFSQLGINAQKYRAKCRYNKQEVAFYENYLIPVFGKDNIELQKTINSHVVDFFIKDKNIVIEYFGDYWHGNPNKYADQYIIPQMKLTCKEIIARDKKRFEEIEKDSNIYCVVIWESDVKIKSKQTFQLLNELNITKQAI